MTVSRPTLDSVTIWRAEMVAKAEGRSLANAVARLVQEAWDARMSKRLTAGLPAHAAARVKAAAGEPISTAS